LGWNGAGKWVEKRTMAADQQLNDSLKELHDLKAAQDEHFIAGTVCLPTPLVARHFSEGHNLKEDL
jgi:hypothetical protein